MIRADDQRSPQMAARHLGSICFKLKLSSGLVDIGDHPFIPRQDAFPLASGCEILTEKNCANIGITFQSGLVEYIPRPRSVRRWPFDVERPSQNRELADDGARKLSMVTSRLLGKGTRRIKLADRTLTTLLKDNSGLVVWPHNIARETAVP
ncbi:hypothetical protein BV22DRAFT_433292 [Leucogyrophana mollusca]|uniref:Uncharacterized protein n=1 Tax=Leucogyrophana mollusca TaxID=85980 RepID=A0ACB8BJF8_9AGAM|nr:hypothetical protein BV22DRAFT_433292 [Leucogyrophana mollusca]